MALIANLQYAWTLFVDPIHLARGWSLAEIQWAFSIFIATETWLTPAAGAIVDRLGPRKGPGLSIAAGGVLVGLGWSLNAFAESLALLYAGAAISGTGAGAIYATCVGNAVKWFPDRRGLAVGLTAGGFGAGAALTVIPIRMTIAAAGYAHAFLWFGLGQAAILVAVAFLLHGPDGTNRAPAARQAAAGRRQPHHREMLRSPVFWLLYVMFVCVSASGLMATAQLGPIAKDFGVSNTPIFFGASDAERGAGGGQCAERRRAAGLRRPVGPHRAGGTMAMAFTLGALSYWLLAVAGQTPWAFVVCAGLIFFTWGEIFSLFPSTCTDTFGPKYATANASLLYTAKGASAFLVPLANVLKTATGGWEAVLLRGGGHQCAWSCCWRCSCCGRCG